MAEKVLFRLPEDVPGGTGSIRHDRAEVPVTAQFNEVMMNLTETVNANGAIQTQYRSLGAQKETATTIQMPIFHRNTLSWDDDRRGKGGIVPDTRGMETVPIGNRARFR